jgi:predicted nucleic acid-binding protein
LKVLIDTDVLMDVALGREVFGPDSRALLEWCQHQPQATFVAWHSISNLFYLLSAARSPSFARSFLGGLLKFAFVASGGTESVRQALTMRMADLEDALQVAAAISANASFIVTRNVADYRGSPIPVLTPAAFLKRFRTEL